jgi:energy-coupling factor transporter ATP-binding protein EcfA2
MNETVTLLKDLVGSDWFRDETSPLKATLHEGDAESHVVVVAGTNASGKSLLLKILANWLRDDKIEPITVSMKYRAGHDVYGPQRLMMFGSEDDESTGVISTSAIKTAFRTARGRDSAHWLLLDEPDIGLSEEYAIPLGRFIGQFASDCGANTKGVAIVSHSKPLIGGMLREMKLRPHFIHVDGTANLGDWLAIKNERTIEELEALSTKGIERYRTIQAFLAARKKRA